VGRGDGEAQARALRSNANKEAWMQVMNKTLVRKFGPKDYALSVPPR